MSKRAKREVETMEYLGMARRLIKRGGERVAESGDEPELAGLASLRDELDAAVQLAVDGWIANGRSWADVGRALGTTRQGAYQRYGKAHRQVA